MSLQKYYYLTSGLFVGFGVGYQSNNYLYGKSSIQLPELITGYSKAKWDLEKQMQQTNDYRVKKAITEEEKIKQYVLPKRGLRLFDKMYQMSWDERNVYCIPNDTQVFMDDLMLKDVSEDKQKAVIALKESLPEKINELINEEVGKLFK